jgi:hypothetical protein
MMKKIAKELLAIAAKLMDAGMFDTERRHFADVTREQLVGIKQAAKKYRGKVIAKPNGKHDLSVVRVTFQDNFPETFAQHDADAFMKAVAHLNLEKFTGMPELVF